jgi:hypothetical protein
MRRAITTGCSGFRDRAYQQERKLVVNEGGQGDGAGAGVYDIAIALVLDCSHAGIDHGGAHRQQP